MTSLELFFFIQLLDFLTTLVGLRLGGAEMSPFIRWTMQVGPVGGLAAVKFLGFAMAAFCLCTGRRRVIVWCNYLFATLVVWNLYNILKAVSALR